jgi:hypothetical protein
MEYKVIDWDGLTKTELEHVLNDLSVKGWRPILTQGNTIIILRRVPSLGDCLFSQKELRSIPLGGYISDTVVVTGGKV